MANIAGIRCIKITCRVIVLIAITFAMLTWALLHGRAGGISGLIMFFGGVARDVDRFVTMSEYERSES